LTEQFRIFLLLIVASIAFGGFTFYAGFVVPTGGRVFDATTQGFVTREVVPWLNYFALATAALFAIEIFIRRRSGNAISGFYWLPICVVTASFGLLISIYPKMNAMLDGQEMSVLEPDAFYQLHRVYLWGSTFQWLALVTIFWGIAGLLYRGSNLNRRSAT